MHVSLQQHQNGVDTIVTSILQIAKIISTENSIPIF